MNMLLAALALMVAPVMSVDDCMPRDDAERLLLGDLRAEMVDQTAVGAALVELWSVPSPDDKWVLTWRETDSVCFLLSGVRLGPRKIDDIARFDAPDIDT